MARFKRLDVFKALQEVPIVPVFFHSDLDVCYEVLKACYNGGIRAFEFTNRGDAAHEIFRALELKCQEEFPEMVLGIGSLVEPGTTSLYLQMGANFVVSPILNEEMAKVCNRRKVAWMPGCGSLSEISKAEELGAEVVKIFPASQVGGPDFIKASRGPMPWSCIMPTGGVKPTEENLTTWFSAGAFCVGLGSQLISKDVIERKAYTELEETVKKAVAIAKAAK